MTASSSVVSLCIDGAGGACVCACLDCPLRRRPVPIALQLTGRAVGVGAPAGLPVGLPRPLPGPLVPALRGPPQVMTAALGVRIGGIRDEPAADAVRSPESNIYGCSSFTSAATASTAAAGSPRWAAQFRVGGGGGTRPRQWRREGGSGEAGGDEATPQASRGGAAWGDGHGGGAATEGGSRPQTPAEAAGQGCSGCGIHGIQCCGGPADREVGGGSPGEGGQGCGGRMAKQHPLL